MNWSNLEPVAVVLIVVGAFEAWKRFSVSGNIRVLTSSAGNLERSPTGKSKEAQDRLLTMGRKALPTLRRKNQQLIAQHARFAEEMRNSRSRNPYDIASMESQLERQHRYVIEIKQARVVDVINEIEQGGSARAVPVKPVRRSSGSFCVTLVGISSAESNALEDALRDASNSLSFVVKREPSAALAAFPKTTVHAMVFNPASLARVAPPDVDVVREATKPGTCRAYLFVSPGELPPSGVSMLDDFIQRTHTQSADAVAKQIIAFFSEADHLNRRNTRLGLRDIICLGAHTVLRVLWPLSYVFAGLHIINTVALFAGRDPWPAAIMNRYLIAAASFFGAFFIVHCIYVICRNGLYVLRIARQFSLGFALPALVIGVAVAATASSIASVDGSTLSIIVSGLLASGAYMFYMYARRIRAECTSLSALQAGIRDPGRRTEILDELGRQPVTAVAFPFLPHRSQSLFISYMHGSVWSRETAAVIHDWTATNGFDVSMDQSSIPSGSLWRQFLIRALSECGFFIAVLDGEAAATEWVLAESAYATMLRKTIGKPRILLIVRNETGLAGLRDGPFGVLYTDLFELQPELCPGAAILIADAAELSDGLILRAMEEVRPMCLLG